MTGPSMLPVALRHRTAYRYDRPVALGPQTVRLRPAPHARAPVLAYALAVLPEPHDLRPPRVLPVRRTPAASRGGGAC